MREESTVPHHNLLREGHGVWQWHLPQPHTGELTVALAAALLPVCLMLEWWQRTSGNKNQPDAGTPTSAAPIHYFDLWRCICVFCVIVTHTWEGYHEENVFGVGQWVLQFLMLISGTCFARSSSSLMRYCWRLLLVWSIGTLLNWMSMVAVSDSWREDGWRVQFQMAFCLQLLVTGVMMAPLKWHLTSGELKPNQDILSGFGMRALLLYGTLVALGLALKLGLVPRLVTCSLSAEETLRRLGVQGMESAGVLFVATLAHCTLPAPAQGWIGWVMILLIQLSRVAHREPRPGSEMHLNDLYAWAAFIYFVPLMSQSAIGVAMAGTWPIWGLVCAFLVGLPGAEPPFPALYPSPEILPRARFYAVEAILVLAFVTIPAAGPERTLTIPSWLGPTLSRLNVLSLVGFISHKAIITLLMGTFESTIL